MLNQLYLKYATHAINLKGIHHPVMTCVNYIALIQLKRKSILDPLGTN